MAESGQRIDYYDNERTYTYRESVAVIEIVRVHELFEHLCALYRRGYRCK